MIGGSCTSVPKPLGTAGTAVTSVQLVLAIGNPGGSTRCMVVRIQVRCAVATVIVNHPWLLIISLEDNNHQVGMHIHVGPCFFCMFLMVEP